MITFTVARIGYYTGLILLIPLWLLLIIGAVIVFFGSAGSLLITELLSEGCHSLTRYWRRMTSESKQQSAELAPLLSSCEGNAHDICGPSQPPCTYAAIAVELVDITTDSDGLAVRELPLQAVKLPYDDIARIAVLSWRWDLDQTQRSRNLTTAIKYAKSVAIKYVFADIKSIHQSLQTAALVGQVTRFSKLYETMAVIIAYDEAKGTLIHTMQRPWIFSEMRLFTRNPNKLTYVGHNDQGVWVYSSALFYCLGRPTRSQFQYTPFSQGLQ